MGFDLGEATRLNLCGWASLGRDRIVRSREGDLSAWLPPPGEDACNSLVLVGLEGELERLAGAGREPIVVPGIQTDKVPGGAFSAAIAWNAQAGQFIVLSTPDLASSQIERLLVGERRARRLVEEQLAAGNVQIRIEEAHYRDIVESGDDLVLRLKSDLSIAFSNRTCCAVLGMDQAQIEGRAIDTIMPAPQGAPSWHERLANGQPVSFEQEWVAQDGSRRWIWWKVQCLDHRAATEWQAVGRDVTLLRQLRAQIDAAQAEARLAAVTRERLRLAHDLHDTLAHSLLALLTQIRLMQTLSSAAPERLDAELVRAEEAAAEGLKQARAAITNIRSTEHGGETLEMLLRGLARDFTARTYLPVAIAIHEDIGGLAGKVVDILARVVSEALRNIERHAQAHEVAIDAACIDDNGSLFCRVSVRDDGIGFDPAAERPGHYGLLGMKEQVEIAGGTLAMDGAGGAGTSITFLLPLEVASSRAEGLARPAPDHL